MTSYREPEIAYPGYRLRITGPPTPVRQAIESALQFCRSAWEGPAVEIRIGLEREGGAFARRLPAGVAEAAAEQDGYRYLAVDGVSIVTMSDPHTVCAARLSADRIDVTAWKRSEDVGRLLPLQSLLVPLLRDLSTREGAMLMHSGSVALPDGRGLLFLGDNGAGKTTTTLALLREGADFLSDDLTLAVRERAGFTMHAVQEAVHVTSQTVAFFPELEAQAGTPRAETGIGKSALAPATVEGILSRAHPRAGRIRNTAPLAAVIAIGVEAGPPALSRLEPAAALGLLARAHTFLPGQPVPGKSFDGLADLVQQVPCYRLRTGTDPQAMAVWLMGQFGDQAAEGMRRAM